MGLENLFKGTAAKVSNLAGMGKVGKSATKQAAAKRGGKRNTGVEKETEFLQPAFFRVELDNGDIDEVLNSAIPVEELKEVSRQIPTILLKHQLPVPTGTKQLPLNWLFYDSQSDSPLHYLKTDDGRHPTFKCVSADTNFNKLGLLPDFKRKQEIELSPGFTERRARVLEAKYRDRSHFEMGFSSSLAGGAFSVGPSPNCRGGTVNSRCETDPEVVEWLNISTKIANAGLEYAIPDATKKMLKKHNIIDASMNRGVVETSEISMISSIQLNSSPIDDKNLSSIGKFGLVHIDADDDPFSWNAYSCTTYHPENYYVGNMIFPALKIACALVPGTTIIFTGRLPHVSRGMGPYEVPEDSPLRHNPAIQLPRPDHGRYRRMGTPAYAKKSLIRTRYLPKNEVLSKGCIKSHWGNRENLRTFEMQLYIREMAYLNTDDNWKKLAQGPNGGKPHPKMFERNANGEEVELKFLLPEVYEELEPK